MRGLQASCPHGLHTGGQALRLAPARALTEACYGVITLLDESGQVQNFLSSRMTSNGNARWCSSRTPSDDTLG